MQQTLPSRCFTRTESLDADWQALLARLKLPPTPLPLFNEAGNDAAVRNVSQPRPGSWGWFGNNLTSVHFTPDLVARVERLEAPMFVEFGYSMFTGSPENSKLAIRFTPRHGSCLACSLLAHDTL